MTSLSETGGAPTVIRLIIDSAINILQEAHPPGQEAARLLFRNQVERTVVLGSEQHPNPQG